MPSSVTAIAATDPAIIANSRLLRFLRSKNQTRTLMAASVSDTATIIDQMETTQNIGGHARGHSGVGQSGIGLSPARFAGSSVSSCQGGETLRSLKTRFSFPRGA